MVVMDPKISASNRTNYDVEKKKKGYPTKPKKKI